MDKSFPLLSVAPTIFLCLLIMNVQPIAASQLYFPTPSNNTKLSSSSSNASLEPPHVYFPTKEEVITAQQDLGPDIYLQLSNASQGPPSQVQAATVTNATVTNATVTNATVTNATVTESNMYVTWIGNGTTVFLSMIPGNVSGLEDQVPFPAEPISLNNTMNASNLQISTLPGLTSITWDAIDADTGLQNIYGSLSRDGMNFYSFQISSGLNNASSPRQPDPHFVLYNETGDPDSVCSGPQLDADANTSTNSTSTAGTEGRSEEFVCRYRWG
jgi:hypothetical protein